MPKLATLVALLSIPATLALAGEVDGPLWLKDDAIKAALSGQTLEGRYANGRTFTESYQTNGRVAYVERGATIGGRWSVTEGTLCTIYDTDPTGGCFRVAKVGKNCFEFYFAARSEQQAPGPDDAKPQWTARGAISGLDVACQDIGDV